jgi:serine/threonine protein phosphatase PrpC
MTVRAAGLTDVGVQRDVNEDRFHVDPARGVFIVIDGVGGQAAGGRAADTALDVVRARLATGNGAVTQRLREAITAANNEVHRQAASRPEWHGMACVLTAAVIDPTAGRAVVGHVGDTRLYKLRGGRIQKVTTDHSPIGEREDAGEISEAEAMRHPRRNEVYRDVGSEPHDIGDPDFVDVRDTPMEPDAALLLCSDGLSDLVPSDAIQEIVVRHAGRPEAVTRALVQAANDAGGKDNITVVYVEGDRFSPNQKVAAIPSPGAARATPWRRVLWSTLFLLAALAGSWAYAGYPIPDRVASYLISEPSAASVIVVKPGQSISDAIAGAEPGSTILVEPGEYRERLTLRSHIRVTSLVPRGATIRLPGSATDEDAAVRAVDVTTAELSGFRIVGDAATPLGTGVLTRSAGVRLIDLEITGAARAALDLGPGEHLMLLSSDIHDNPGAGLVLRADASPRIVHNTFSGNGASEQAASSVLIEAGARPDVSGNTFWRLDPRLFTTLGPAALVQLRNLNWFPQTSPTNR